MKGRHGGNPMKKIAYLIGALACLVGLFYLVLALTSHL